VIKPCRWNSGKERVSEMEVRIVTLEPMRVASVRAQSKSPENEAWEKMRAWAEPRGLLGDVKKHPVFGFNNPDPSPDREDYGYEFWIRVGQDIEPEGEVEIRDFAGGLYAVTTCRLLEEIESDLTKEIGYMGAWKKLADWVKDSRYEFGRHQPLEKAQNPGASMEELVLDLYCPIKE
jgi:DNA gyrase inhibitor GyrI